MKMKTILELWFGMNVMVVGYGGVGVEVEDLHLVAFEAPAPPEEMVLEATRDDRAQRVTHEVVELARRRVVSESRPVVAVVKHRRVAG